MAHSRQNRNPDFGDVVTIPQAPPITRYICNETTIRRDLDGWTLVKLLNIAMGGALEISLTDEQFARLSPDVKQHFKPVRGE
jgi:hypothetical protein